MPIAALLTLAPSILQAGETIYNFITQERQRLQQTGEWTADQETQFQNLQTQRASQPWQKPMDPAPAV